MKRRLSMVLCIIVLASLMAGCCAGLVTKRVGQSAATRVIGKVQEEVAKSQTQEQATEASTEQQEEPTPEPEATVDAVPPSGGGTESGGCLDGFPRYPGVKDSEDAKSFVRILMANGVFKESRAYGTKDPVAKVIAFYQKEPADLGWEAPPIQGQVDQGGASLWWHKEKEGRTVLMMITDDKGKGTLIGIVCQPPTE